MAANCRLSARGLVTLLLCCAVTSTAWSQTRNGTRQPRTPKQPASKPAAEKKPRPAPVHHDATAAPAFQPAAPPPAAAAKAKPAEEEPPAPLHPEMETNPAVRAALEMPRKEPRDYVEVILLLVDLGRPELAKTILGDLTKLQVTDAQRVAIVEEFGSQGMLHLARATELAPDAATFADACMAAASAAANNPQRIAGLVQQLYAPSPDARAAARSDLAATGKVGVVASLQALAQEADPQRRAALVAAAEFMHPLVDGPLLAMLETRDPKLYADVAGLLVRLRVPQAAPLLAANSAGAEKALADAISHYRHGTPPFAVDEANQVEMWKWDDATHQLTSVRVPADQAQTIWIARLADTLARIRPDSAIDQRAALVLRLESAGITSGTPAATNAAAALGQIPPQQLSEALADALKNNYSHAALALVDALAAHGDQSILLTADGKPSPLADALNSPDRRVRFAALKAIAAMNPATPYPGSSRVPDALTWFAGSAGERQAVVAMPTNAGSTDLAGKLNSHELEAEATNRGRELVDMARAMPDLELIIVDMDILAPSIRQVLYELRISPTTGDVPIALLAADGRLEAAKRLATEHTRVFAVPRPHTPEAVTNILDNLAQLAARSEVPAAERAAEAQEAAKWLALLSSGNRPFYTFRRAPLRTAAVPRPLVAAPAELPSAAARPTAESPTGTTPAEGLAAPPAELPPQ